MAIQLFRIPAFLLMLFLLETLVSASSVTDQIKWPPGQVPVGETNGPDGLDDIWQEQFNAWGIDPAADTDNDGFSNSLEAVAGTNPFMATDSFKIGNMTIVGNAVVFTTKIEAGKKYRVLSSDAPNGSGWVAETLQTPVSGTEYIPSADQAAATISILMPGNTKKFYKLETSDVSSSGDGVSDWVKRKLGLVPGVTDSNGDGISDVAEITQMLQTPDVVTVEAESAFASEDGGPPGLLRLRRNQSLMGAWVHYTLGGSATAGTDFSGLSGSVYFAPGAKTAMIAINPIFDSVLEGGESVIVTLDGGMAGTSTPLVIDQTKKQAAVIISNTTAPSGTGLLARYYDHASTIYAHAANFGDAGTYVYTRSGTSPNYTGTIVIPYTKTPAVQVGQVVRVTFTGGNLNNAAYNNLDYTITAATPGTNFTLSLSGAGLPTNSSSTCNFSIQSFPHPAVIERVEPTVDFEWMGGTPNGVGVAAAAGTTATNVPDNYSDTFEMYLSPATAGSYRFQLDADDRARVLLDLNDGNGLQEILEHGWDGEATPETIGTFKISGSYNLAVPASPANRYKMRVEHVETTGEARCRLQWSRNGGTFVNIPQAEQLTHTQAITYAFTRGTPVTTGTATITLTGHGLSVGSQVDLAFSNGTLFTPNAIDPNGYSGTYTVATVPTSNTFTVTLNSTGSTLPGNQSAGATGFLENRSTSTTTGVYNKTYTTTDFTKTPGRIGVDTAVTASNNGLWGTGTPDVALINPDTFSVRWTGQIQPQFTEEYTISVLADDGSRLLINGVEQDLKMLPSADSGGSTYFYDSTTGKTIVNYANSVLKLGGIVPGESLRLNPTNGNLNLGNGSTYTYDSLTGDMVVNYSNLTNVTPNGFVVGEIVEVDPTGGPATSLVLLPYEITAATANTFTVNIGAGAFDSGSGSINVSDNSDREVLEVYGSGTGTYSHNQTTGVTVVNYIALGYPANTFQTGHTVLLDPTSGNLSAQPYAHHEITAATASTFTVNYGTSFATGTGNILIVATGSTGIPADKMGAFLVNFGAGKHANASVGSMNFNFVSKAIKPWASNGNERFVRLPMVGGVRYDIQLEYYESTGFSRCRLFWMSPSQPKQIIPAERMYPASDPVLAPASHVSPTDATALVGGGFSYAVEGSNGASVSLSGTPPWLTFANGMLNGTPPPGSAGLYQILITLTNDSGTSISVLNLKVEETGGTVEREVWTGIAGTSVSSIPVGTSPDTSDTHSTLTTPTDFGDNYGARIRGYITAPETGNYYFWIAGSNAAELWISNDDDPINTFKRAWVANGTAPQQWTAESNQKSPWMALKQGRRYYVEILHKAGTGAGDNLAVGWSKPGENESAPAEIVPAYVLSPYAPPPPGSTPGTLYVATMLSQGSAITNGVGTATLRLSEDETVAHVAFTHHGLTGPVTDWHVHSDPFLTHASAIIYDGTEPMPGDGPQPDGTHKWNIVTAGTLSAGEIIELLKQGKAYINLHTAEYPAGEIRGNFTLANGSRTFSPPPPPPMWADDSDTNVGAARFLTQASFGPSVADITSLKALAPSGGSAHYPASRYETWIDNQFAQSWTEHLAEVLRTEMSNAQGGAFDETLSFNAWWRSSISGVDQLRQRVAFALSEIHVVSAQGPLDNRAETLSYFYDKLGENAFGNFRTILETTTLTPSMGRYLDMLRNDKPDLSTGRIPNENYAREIKQLFSVGLYRVWPDGTLMLNSKDSPIDTYTQSEIVGYSHVFTGWDYGYDGMNRTALNAPANWMRQMRATPARHFTGPKLLLNNEVLPGLRTLGGQPLDPYATHISAQVNHPEYKALPDYELAASHDQLFNHPNVGPFICRQLIQRLVTSHPSRDYLYRVVQKFNDNGSGVRGDMKAVVKAILLDFEARSPGMVGIPAYGKQREPLLRVAAAARAFRKAPWFGTYTQSATDPTDPRRINITTAQPHGFSGTSNQLLEFTSGNPAPWTGVYSVAQTGNNTLRATANGWAAGTYSIPANSTTCTITMTNHWLQVGHQVFVNFYTGGANNVAGLDEQVYTLTSASAQTGTNGTFTFNVGITSTSVRSGNVMIPRFSPGSYQYSNNTNGVPVDQQGTYNRLVTMDVANNTFHELNVGDQVQLNFYGGNPTPNDAVVTVHSIVDANTWTFLANNTAMNLGNNSQGFNSVYQFPLKSLPLTRSGNVGTRPSTFAMNNTTLDLDQAPINSPTVFNFFLPDFKFPGALASQGITTPEFQETAETSVIRQANYIYNGLLGTSAGNTLDSMSSFNNGSNALLMNYSAWMTPGTTGPPPPLAPDIGLGAAGTPTVPWTHNQNITLLVDHLSVLLTADQLSAQAKQIIKNFVSTKISAISATSPCTVTTEVPHNLSTGDTICISGVTNGTFSTTLNSTTTTRTITVDSPTTFRLNGTNSVNCTAAPNAAGVANAHVSTVVYNQGTTAPSNANRRDRIRSIIHLILTSPDFTIQR